MVLFVSYIVKLLVKPRRVHVQAAGNIKGAGRWPVPLSLKSEEQCGFVSEA